MIEPGFCQCGCGASTKIIKTTAEAKGRIAGDLNKYLLGHNPKHAKDYEAAFWSKIIKKESGCWEWIGRRNGQGYGRTYFKGNHWVAHRLAWFLTNGELNGLHALHKCDNPPCCNPGHLFLGTDQDNSDDRQNKGRLAPFKGEDHWKAKLTWEKVEEIRRLCKETPRSQIRVSDLFGIHKSVVGKIIKNQLWVV